IRVINWPLKRLMLSMGAGKYVRFVTGMPFSDTTGGYKCFRRHALLRVKLDDVRSNGESFQIAMTRPMWTPGVTVQGEGTTGAQRMLKPLPTPAKPPPCHVQTTPATTVPQLTPNSNAVTNSLRRAPMNQREVGCVARRDWIVTVMDWTPTLSLRPSTMVRKN